MITTLVSLGLIAGPPTGHKILQRGPGAWCRNPSQGGFGIPLLDRGNTRTFNPDFLVWTEKTVVAIDTKGDHLITEWQAQWQHRLHRVGAEARQTASNSLHHDRRGRPALPESVKGQDAV
jgi:hypothetical protein